MDDLDYIIALVAIIGVMFVLILVCEASDTLADYFKSKSGRAQYKELRNELSEEETMHLCPSEQIITLADLCNPKIDIIEDGYLVIYNEDNETIAILFPATYKDYKDVKLYISQLLDAYKAQELYDVIKSVVDVPEKKEERT